MELLRTTSSAIAVIAAAPGSPRLQSRRDCNLGLPLYNPLGVADYTQATRLGTQRCFISEARSCRSEAATTLGHGRKMRGCSHCVRYAQSPQGQAFRRRPALVGSLPDHFPWSGVLLAAERAGAESGTSSEQQAQATVNRYGRGLGRAGRAGLGEHQRSGAHQRKSGGHRENFRKFHCGAQKMMGWGNG